MNPNKIHAKNAVLFNCEKCSFKCYKKSEWSRHILTAKHKILTNPNEKTPEKKNECNCGKIYKHRSSLCAHKKICNFIENTENIKEKNEITTELILNIIQQNQELQKQMIELAKNSGNNNNVNSNNTKFNINLFLNETCKDAINLTDFVSSIQLQLDDLDNVGKNGYVSGISNIIIRNLNLLDVNKRPIHCSDFKREIMYVKDDNKWEKEKEHEKLTKAVNKVSYKNVLQIPAWQKENKGCEYSHNKKNDEYLQIVNESMGAFTEEENTKNMNKIIKNVAKEVIIEKEY